MTSALPRSAECQNVIPIARTDWSLRWENNPEYQHYMYSTLSSKLSVGLNCLALLISSVFATDDNSDNRATLTKLNNIIIPEIRFQDTPVRDAFKYIRDQSKEHDHTSSQGNQGVNLVLKLPDDADKTLIVLDLDNVPVMDALRYVCELAGLKLKVEPHAVRIAHVLDPSF